MYVISPPRSFNTNVCSKLLINYNLGSVEGNICKPYIFEALCKELTSEILHVFYTILLGCYVIFFSGHAVQELTFIHGYWPFTFISALGKPRALMNVSGQ